MRLIVLCIRIIGPISRGNRSRISNNLCLSIRGWIYLDTDHISYIGTRKSVAYKRIGAVRYAGTKGISLCFIAAIKETLSRLCQGEQLDGKGKNDLVVSVSSNPFVRLPVTYIPSVARWYHRWYHSIRVTTIFSFLFFFSFSFLRHASILSLSIVGKFLRLRGLLMTIMRRSSSRVSNNVDRFSPFPSSFSFPFSFLFSETRVKKVHENANNTHMYTRAWARVGCRTNIYFTEAMIISRSLASYKSSKR